MKNKILLILVLSMFMILLVNSASATVYIAGTTTSRANSDGTVTTTFILASDKATVVIPERILIEVQPKAYGTLGSIIPLFAFIESTGTCNPSTPNNIHYSIKFTDKNIAHTFGITTPPLAKGSYDIYVVSVDRCCVKSDGTQQSCNALNPFNWGRYINSVTVSSTTSTSYCGDLVCNSDPKLGRENIGNCYGDCYPNPGSWCGDGYCDPSKENSDNCNINGGGDCTGTTPTCSDGIKNQDETGIDCGGSICPACVQTCNSNGTCDTGEDIVNCPDDCGNQNKCETTPPCTGATSIPYPQCWDVSTCTNASATEPYFSVRFVNPPKNVKAGDNINLQVSIANNGADGTLNVEAGMYYDDTLKSWGEIFSIYNLFSAVSTQNCYPTQTNVGTKKVTLKQGKSETITIPIKIPTACGRDKGLIGLLYSTDSYAFNTIAYKNCYKETIDNPGISQGITGYDVFNDVLVDTRLFCTSGTCSDGLVNQDETDTDCGGTKCNPCDNTFKCTISDDCSSGYCNNGYCSDGGNGGADTNGTKSTSMLLSDWLDTTISQRTKTLCREDSDCDIYTNEKGDELKVSCLATSKIQNQLQSDVDKLCDENKGIKYAIGGGTIGSITGCIIGGILGFPGGPAVAGAGCVIGAGLFGTTGAGGSYMLGNALYINCENKNIPKDAGACIAQGGLDLGWFGETTNIGGMDVPNWIFIAGGIIILMLLFSMMGGGKR